MKNTDDRKRQRSKHMKDEEPRKKNKKVNEKKSENYEYIYVETKKENKSKNIDNKENKKERNKKSSANRKAMKVVVSFLLLLIIGATAFVGYKIQLNGGGITGILATMLGEDKESLENLKPINVLIMGVSGVDDYKLADSIMVVSYNPKNQKAAILSIPRDTYVGRKDRRNATQNYIASYKINAVYRNGENIPEAMDRISEVLGLEIENYVIIDTKALQKLVDAIGGVTFDVPIDMDYEDSSQDLYIHLKAGEQLIDGAKAEQLLRFRHNDDGSTYPSSYGQQDLGRMRTQREFVTATVKQTVKPQNIFKLKQILDIMSEDVNTNLEVNSIKKYIPYAVEFDTENLKTGMVPGDVEMRSGVSIYVASKSETAALVEELFGAEGTNSITDEEEDSANTEN